jgi:hypothetical protein
MCFTTIFLAAQVQPAMESANPLHQRAAYQAVISNIVQEKLKKAFFAVIRI